MPEAGDKFGGKIGGKVYLVGAGPGAPDLVTLRAARVLAEADIVFHDALVHPDTIALATRAIKVAVGKRCGRHSTAQRFINKRLIDAAEMHPIVVRLKGGDPMLFGRAQEEISALLAAGIEVEIVPGVTAALAASAVLQVSLTRRTEASNPGSRSVVFVTPRLATSDEHGGTAPSSDWIAVVLAADTAVLYMASREADVIATQLIAAGKAADTPVAVVRNATLADQEIALTTLERLASGADAVSRGADGPTTLCIGDVYRQALALAGKVHEKASAEAQLDGERCRVA